MVFAYGFVPTPINAAHVQVGVDISEGGGVGRYELGGSVETITYNPLHFFFFFVSISYRTSDLSLFFAFDVCVSGGGTYICFSCHGQYPPSGHNLRGRGGVHCWIPRKILVGLLGQLCHCRDVK